MSAGPPPPAVEATALRRHFGRRHAVDGVDLRLEAGECLALFGPNGAGKTTLLRLLAGLLRPTSGRAMVRGVALPGGAEARGRVGLISHRTMLYPALTARENVEFAARLYGVPGPREAADAALRRLRAHDRADAAVRALSRGLQQRVAIARAVVHAPDVLLLDEPYTGLDEAGAAALTAVLRGLAAEGAAVVLVTHHLDEGLALATHAAVMRAGRIVRHEPRAAIDRAAYGAAYRQEMLSALGSRPSAGAVAESREPAAESRWSAESREPRAESSLPESPSSAEGREPSARPPGLFAAAWLIARKDLAVEFRTRTAFLSALAFALLAVVIFYFAWDPTAVSTLDLAPGVLWVIFTFSGILGLHRAFAVEHEERAIDALLGAPVEREAIYLGKAFANFLFVLGVQAVTIPAVVVFYNLPVGVELLALAAIAALAAVGLVAVGTLFSAMTVNTRLAELLLPVVALPFFVPIVMGAAQASARLLAGRPVAEAGAWLRLLLGFDLVFAFACMVAFPYTLDE